jgi:hypothetical protein
MFPNVRRIKNARHRAQVSRLRPISTPQNPEFRAINCSPTSTHVTDVEVSEKRPAFRHVSPPVDLEKRGGGANVAIRAFHLPRSIALAPSLPDHVDRYTRPKHSREDSDDNQGDLKPVWHL